MKEKTLHMVGNAHIDPVWLWQWQEGYHEVLSTFRSALDRMDEDPEFVFTASSAAFYEWVEQCNPAMFEEIRRRVSEGRWQLTGGWWIEPDCNIPSGESFVRQGLYGQRYFKEKFGKIARVGYNPDSFGHNGMLPQILKKSGLDGYMFLRPQAHEKGLPADLFWWEADDGSRVLAFRIPYEYCSWPSDIDRHVRRVAATLKPPFAETICFFGVGNHGGGPTKENLACIHRLEADPDAPRLVFDGPEALLALARPGKVVEGKVVDWEIGKSVDRENGNSGDQSTNPQSTNPQSTNPQSTDSQSTNLPIPVVHEDLQHHASGCYSAHSGVKRWNRLAENALAAAEKWAAVASWTLGAAYPRAELARAWKSVLFNQFHDIMAGTSIEPAYQDAASSYGEAMAIAARVQNCATQAIGWNVPIEQQEGVRPLVVFNPHAWEARVSVETEFGRFNADDVLADDDGNQVAVQAVQSAASSRGRNRLCFVADLPPMGYRVYRVGKEDALSLNPSLDAGRGQTAATPNASPIWRAEAADLVVDGNTIENARFRLEINPETGAIKSLFDKIHNTQAFIGDAARAVVLDDPSDTWSHNVYRYDRVAGTFTPRRITLSESGPVRATIRVESEYGRSTLSQEFSLYRDLDRVDVTVTVDWREEHKALKLRFPANIGFQKVTYEIPYGHIERFANGDEDPGQGWVDVSGESRDTGELYGVSILNDGKYSFDVALRDIGMTVLRSPIYAHHIPYAPQPEGRYTFMDQGIQSFHYTILPHAGSWEQAGTVRRTAELNQRPSVLPATYHPKGSLPRRAAFVSVDRDNVVVSVVKQAEDGGAEDGAGDLVLRAYETDKAATRARICLPHWGREVEVDFGPCEIKTLRVPKDAGKPVVETNLLEYAE